MEQFNNSYKKQFFLIIKWKCYVLLLLLLLLFRSQEKGFELNAKLNTVNKAVMLFRNSANLVGSRFFFLRQEWSDPGAFWIEALTWVCHSQQHERVPQEQEQAGAEKEKQTEQSTLVTNLATVTKAPERAKGERLSGLYTIITKHHLHRQYIKWGINTIKYIIK